VKWALNSQVIFAIKKIRAQKLTRKKLSSVKYLGYF